MGSFLLFIASISFFIFMLVKGPRIFKITFVLVFISMMSYHLLGSGKSISIGFFLVFSIYMAVESFLGVLVVSLLSILTSLIPSIIIYLVYYRDDTFLRYIKIFKKTVTSFFIFFMVYIVNYNLLSHKSCSVGFQDLFFGGRAPYAESCVKISEHYSVQKSGVFVFIVKDGRQIYNLWTLFTVKDNYIIIEKKENYKGNIVGYDVLNMQTDELKSIKKLTDINITKPLKFYGLREYSTYKRSIYGWNDLIILLLSLVLSSFILRKVLKDDNL